MIVGVLGGIGAGKSTVTRMLAELGADTVDADALAHEALESSPVTQALVAWIGSSVIARDGKVDRKVLANLVFSSSEKLKKLESLIHPEVLRRIEEKLKTHKTRRKDGRLLVLDVPLLLETPLKDRCEEVVFVDASPAVRRKRVEARGWSADEIKRRESLQATVAEKRRLAGHIIDNSGSLADTRRQVTSLYARWRARSKKEGGA